MSAREWCARHRSYFCPCAAPHLYRPPFTRGKRDDTHRAMRAWDEYEAGRPAREARRRELRQATRDAGGES